MQFYILWRTTKTQDQTINALKPENKFIKKKTKKYLAEMKVYILNKLTVNLGKFSEKIRTKIKQRHTRKFNRENIAATTLWKIERVEKNRKTCTKSEYWENQRGWTRPKCYQHNNSWTVRIAKSHLQKKLSFVQHPSDVNWYEA